MADTKVSGRSRGDDDGDDKHKHERSDSGLLKFSALAATSVEVPGTPLVSYIADGGVVTESALLPSHYPMARKRRFDHLAVNVIGYTVIGGGSIVVELLKNGVVQPEFTITYVGGESGVKVVGAHKTFETGDTFDLRVTTAGLTDTDGVNLSATIGVDPA